MPGLGETYGGEAPDVAGLAKLGFGFGLVVGGGAILASGVLRVVGDAASALGVPAPFAARLGLTLALLVVPLALAGLRTRLPGTAGKLPLAAGGGVVGIAIVGSWATAPPGAGATGAGVIGGLALPILLAYAIGLLLLSAGVLAGPVAARSETGRAASARSSVGFRRSSGSPGAPSRGITPADGGRDVDEDLEFPLDEE